jgi:ADP-heptose:LPS heptosyltransferase/SAM-dependent methyltransferase
VTDLDPERLVGEEARKSHAARISSGFIDRYLSGSAILDIGYRGYLADVVPIVPNAVGVELDYPGYDGTTLPFQEETQDAVFASHCLEHIEDFQNAIRDWFRVLRIGGFLIVMVPHKFLYEKQTGLPSRYNADHKRFYTPASLMAEIEMSLRPNTYRLRHLVDNDRHYDYMIPPERHSGGCYEIELVIEKIRPPSWVLAKPLQPGSDRGDPAGAQTDIATFAASPSRIVGPAHGGNPAVRVIATEGGDVALYDFGARLATRPRILALKLDHLGDFVIGLPALRRLREAFPDAHIRLVVGSWNRAQAAASGLADDVVGYDYFPQISLGWDGTPHERVEKFQGLAEGFYDIAIDLRVDEDTRWLLGEVDAYLRCGIGAVTRHAFLDVALPPEHPVRDNVAALDRGLAFIAAERFNSRMPARHTFFHESDLRPVEGHLVFGPHVALPVGRFRVTFDLHIAGWASRLAITLNRPRVTLDVARDGSEIVALRRLHGAELRTRDSFDLEFDNEDAAAHYEFRIHLAGKPRVPHTDLVGGTLRFAGVRLTRCDTGLQPRYRRAELHIGEQLSLLVQLVRDRAVALYDEQPPRSAAGMGQPHRIAVAPFSNSDLRDWPFAHYVRLVEMLLAETDGLITLLGSGQQAEQLERLAEAAGGGPRIRNLGGQTAWSDMPALLRDMDLVICNNSGIAHLAAASGARTLAIYSASHQPQEWGPRGQNAHALMAVVGCSPCGHDRLEDCPYEHRCMQGLAPDTVFAEVRRLLSADVSALTA